MIAAATAASPLNRATASSGTAVPGEKLCSSLCNGWVASAVAGLKELAPYAAIELILPGGSLIALLLWLRRRRQVGRRSASGPAPSLFLR